MGEAYVNFTPMSATKPSCLQLHKGMRPISPATRTISITQNVTRLDYEPSNRGGLGLEALDRLDYQRNLCSRGCRRQTCTESCTFAACNVFTYRTD